MSEDRDLRRQVALFQFRLIAPLVHLPTDSDELAAVLRIVSAREHEIPAARRIQVRSRTGCGWRTRASTACCGRMCCWARAGPGGAESAPPAAL